MGSMEMIKERVTELEDRSLEMIPYQEQNVPLLTFKKDFYSLTIRFGKGEHFLIFLGPV